MVYVVTGLELGWDCIVGVFQGVELEELQRAFPKDQYVIHEKSIETSCSDWYD